MIFRYAWLLLLSLVLTGCIPPPKDDGVGKRSAPVQMPNTGGSNSKILSKSQKSIVSSATRAEEKDNSLKKNQRPQGLPRGWTLLDPKNVILRIEQDPKSNSIVLFTVADSGVEVVGARDASKQDRYRGKLDGGHLIALSPVTSKILVLFSDRHNAKFSVLLSYSP